MFRIILTFLFVLFALPMPAQYSISAAIGSAASMRQSDDHLVTSLTVSRQISEQFHLAVNADYLFEATSPSRSSAFDAEANYLPSQHYSDITCSVLTSIPYTFHLPHLHYDLLLNTGFGWQHHFTDAPVDHNYHSYTLGLEYRLHYPPHRISGIVRAGAKYRAPAAHHIGFNANFGHIYFQVGICYTISRNHAYNAHPVL